MDQRAERRLAFAHRAIGTPPDRIEPASADASFRSYWRVHAGDRCWMLMDAPPAHEDCRPFVAIARQLEAAGLHPPRIHAEDLDDGFVLLEDLGDTLFADRLDEASVDELYGHAFAMLARFTTMETATLEPFDAARLGHELSLFPNWFLGRQLQRPPDQAFERWWRPLTEQLIESALSQPQVFVHRDFHCGNLMLAPAGPAVIDFQDAAAGPATYDLVSLLYDRYITWPRHRIKAWAEAQREVLAPDIDAAHWLRWFDWMALQRNLKIIGIFARLNLRDGKPRYLDWQPRFFGYVADTARRYPELETLSRFLEALPFSATRS